VNETHRLVAARVLAALAIVSLPAFIWLGWWQLVVSIGFGVAAVMIAPHPDHHRTSGRTSRLFRALQQRLHPHSWRPRGR
jgi:hypothetical protein